MRTFRSYLASELKEQPVAGQYVVLKGEEAHHLLRVLRIRVGDRVVLFDGKGRTWQCTFCSGKGTSAKLEVLSVEAMKRKGPQVFLAQCLAKTRAMESLMRHATEMGVSGVIPLQSAHADVRLEGERGSKRVERLRSIAIEACKQSGNVFVPQVAPIQYIKDWVEGLEALEPQALRLTASLERDTEPLLAKLEEAGQVESITWLVGPEGDLSEEEYAQARVAGFLPVRLASQVLRVETAALYVLAATDAYYQNKR